MRLSIDKALEAEIAQLEERETEVLKVAGSIPAFGNFFHSTLKIIDSVGLYTKLSSFLM